MRNATQIYEDAWADYCYWQTQGQENTEKNLQTNQGYSTRSFCRMGKPEPLKYDYQGAWSRRIDAENRLIYMMDGDSVAFLSFKDHY